jgi:hypothetical protein
VPDEDFNLKSLEFRLATLHEDVRDVRTSMTKLAEAITKLALVEERQLHANHTMERLITHQTLQDERLKALEIAAPAASRASQWLDRGIVFSVGALFMFALKKLGLL